MEDPSFFFMTEQLTQIYRLFREATGRGSDATESEAIIWALEQELIRDDEFGAYCMAGLVE